MRIGIIGAGFTGLTAAYQLVKDGHEVMVFEKDSQPGGLAIGYQEKDWEWSLEKHYHHWFTNDRAILNLAKEIGYPVIINRPKSSFFVNNTIYQFDSPIKILGFPQLSLFEKFRMIAALGFLRVYPFWKTLEGINADATLPKMMGEKAYEMLWKPQLYNKMGEFADKVSLVWFWSRIQKRTQSLAYPKGGYLKFAQSFTKIIQKMNGKVIFNTELVEIQDTDSVKVTVKNQNDQKGTQTFDKLIITLPSFALMKAAPQLPEGYKQSLKPLQGLAATNIVMRMKKQFLTDGTYWLSICQKESPVMVLVEHTNFMDKKHYNNEHLMYIGNYLPVDSPNFFKTKEELLAIYNPLLQKINPDYEKNIIGYELFKAPFAQPIVPTYYSKMIPPFKTPLPHVFLANMQQVYPHDRGTNYAVELGEKIATIATK